MSQGLPLRKVSDSNPAPPFVSPHGVPSGVLEDKEWTLPPCRRPGDDTRPSLDLLAFR